MNAIKIFPSLISSDLLNLERTIRALEPYCAGFHIDIMDWHFVPNLTWGPAFVQAFAQCTTKPLYIHLMIEKVISFLPLLTVREGDTISFHIEQSEDILTLIKSIKEKKCKVGIAIKPKTPVTHAVPFLEVVDSVLLMSVEPGFSGQAFLQAALDRLQELVSYRAAHGLTFEIAMDGGINHANIRPLFERGVDQVAVASAIFSQADPVQALRDLYSL